MGMNTLTYKVSNLIFDFIFYYVLCVIVIIIGNAFSMEYFRSWYATVMLLLWGPAQVSLGYLIAAFFKKDTSVTIVSNLLVLGFFGVGACSSFLLYMGENIPPFYFMVFPPLALFFGSTAATRYGCNPSKFDIYPKSLATKAVGASIAYFVIFGIVAFFLSM